MRPLPPPLAARRLTRPFSRSYNIHWNYGMLPQTWEVRAPRLRARAAR